MLDSGLSAPSRLALLALSLGVLAGCELNNTPDPPYRDPPPDQRLRGQALMVQYQCGSCHAIPQVPAARGHAGPSLAGFGRRSYIAGEIPNGPGPLARWIVEPGAVVPGTAMPAMGVSPQDARDMAAYLLTLT
jgi:cytochrome c